MDFFIMEIIQCTHCKGKWTYLGMDPYPEFKKRRTIINWENWDYIEKEIWETPMDQIVLICMECKGKGKVLVLK